MQVPLGGSPGVRAPAGFRLLVGLNALNVSCRCRYREAAERRGVRAFEDAGASGDGGHP